MADKPKLLLIGHTYMVAVNREKAVHLASRFQVHVCTVDPRGWITLGSEVTDSQPEGHRSAYDLSRLKRWPAWQKYTSIFLIGLGRELRDFRPDVVLVENEPWSFLRWQARVLVLLHNRRTRFVEFTWENVERSGLKGRVLSLVYRLAAATSDLVICGNKGAKKICMEAGFHESRTLIAPQLGFNPSDHPVSTPAETAEWKASLGWPSDAIVIGFCGRLVEEKGLDELYAAAEGLRAVHPKLRLALLGAGSMKDMLWERDPSGEWMKILPAVRHEEIPAFLNKLDIFVLPSKPKNSSAHGVWEEQFGHVLIEAMACGTFTLGSNSGAIPEVLNDSTVTFQHSNTQSLASMLAVWLAKPEQMEGKAAIQREICHRLWTHAAVAERYAEFLIPYLRPPCHAGDPS